MLSEDRLEDGLCLGSERTYSRPVERAGSGLWEGEVAEMRRDEEGKIAGDNRIHE